MKTKSSNQEEIDLEGEESACLMEKNQGAYQNLVDQYEDIYLFPAEAQVFDRFRNEWTKFSILDLGVGAGRTACVFSPMAMNYTGLDYASAMIDRCLERFEPADHRNFIVGDARDLNMFGEDHFDFVIFSFNGIDYIDDKGRQRVYREIRRVLKPGGWFFFSTHSLDAFPFMHPIPSRLKGWLAPLGWTLKLLIENRLRIQNRNVDLEKAKNQGWAYLRDYCPDVCTYYITPQRQVDDLEQLGFSFDSAWDREGGSFDFSVRPEQWMIHFLFRGPKK